MKQQMHLTLPSCWGVKPGSRRDPAGRQWQQSCDRGCGHCPHASPRLGTGLLLLLAKNSLELFLTALPREMAQSAVGKRSSWQCCLLGQGAPVWVCKGPSLCLFPPAGCVYCLWLIFQCCLEKGLLDSAAGCSKAPWSLFQFPAELLLSPDFLLFWFLQGLFSAEVLGADNTTAVNKKVWP